MKNVLLLILFSQTITLTMAMDYELLSQDFLYAVRVNDDFNPILKHLEDVSVFALNESLDTEERKMAFWLNIYNAFIQIKASDNPEMIKNKRNDFFSRPWIPIAGRDLSFDEIEHSILRHSQWKLGLGYIHSWFPSEYEKIFRLDEVDYRIHFALNCGAAGCPPIAFYKADEIESQLETATAGFLQLNSDYNQDINQVEVSKILSWFKGDFGGKSGILEILKKHDIIPANCAPKIVYKDYDWTISLSNYIK